MSRSQSRSAATTPRNPCSEVIPCDWLPFPLFSLLRRDRPGPVDEPLSEARGVLPPRVRRGVRTADGGRRTDRSGSLAGRRDHRHRRARLALAARSRDRSRPARHQRAGTRQPPRVASGRDPAGVPPRRQRAPHHLVARSRDRGGNAPLRGRLHRPRPRLVTGRRNALLQRLHRGRPRHLAAFARNGGAGAGYRAAGVGGPRHSRFRTGASPTCPRAGPRRTRSSSGTPRGPRPRSGPSPSPRRPAPAPRGGRRSWR